MPLSSRCRRVLIDAVLSAEDRDFFKHGGVDPVGHRRAPRGPTSATAGSTQGGSTITQQYVKNVYLTDERTLSRKVKEAVLAVKLEQKFSKHEILERYLNTVYFGRGAYGVGAASRDVLRHRRVANSTSPQAAYLAGLIRVARDGRRPARSRRRPPSAATPCCRDGARRATSRRPSATRPTRCRGPSARSCLGGTILPRSRAGELRRRHGQRVRHAVLRRRTSYKQLHDHGFTDAEIYSAAGCASTRRSTTTCSRPRSTSVKSTLDQPDDPAAALVADRPRGSHRGDGRRHRLLDEPGELRRSARTAAAAAARRARR